MHAIICVVSDLKKDTSSTSGMQKTVETSSLLQHRIKEVVPKRMEEMTKAIVDKDFDTFARITMADSNSFHAVCCDTDPPIFYLNDMSRDIIRFIVEYNRASVATSGHLKAAYTFDAGPNAVIYTLKENVAEILKLVQRFFPPQEEFLDPEGILKAAGDDAVLSPPGFNEAAVRSREKGVLKSIIHTMVGDGPRDYSREHSLLDSAGMPKSLK
jgi:diphosphomevalonate decarboxylase